MIVVIRRVDRIDAVDGEILLVNLDLLNESVSCSAKKTETDESSFEIDSVALAQLDGERIGVVLEVSSEGVAETMKNGGHWREQIGGEEEGNDDGTIRGGNRIGGESKRSEERSVVEEKHERRQTQRDLR